MISEAFVLGQGFLFCFPLVTGLSIVGQVGLKYVETVLSWLSEG